MLCSCLLGTVSCANAQRRLTHTTTAKTYTASSHMCEVPSHSCANELSILFILEGLRFDTVRCVKFAAASCQQVQEGGGCALCTANVWHVDHSVQRNSSVCGVTGSSAARGRHISMTTPYTVRPTKKAQVVQVGHRKAASMITGEIRHPG